MHFDAIIWISIHTADATTLCVLNSQKLVHDGFGRKMKTEHVENLSSRVGWRIGNWVTTIPAGEYTPPGTTQLYMFSFQFFAKSASAVVVSKLRIQYTSRDADATQLDTCVASASAVCIGLKITYRTQGGRKIRRHYRHLVVAPRDSTISRIYAHWS